MANITFSGTGLLVGTGTSDGPATVSITFVPSVSPSPWVKVASGVALAGINVPLASTTGVNLIVVHVGFNGPGAPSVTDSQHNTYTKIIDSGTGGAGGDSALFYVSNPSVANGMTVTVPALSYGAFEVEAWSGAASVNALDKFSSFKQPTGTTFQPGSVAPLSNNELIVTGAVNAGATISGVDSGFTLVNRIGLLGSNFGSGDAYLVQATASAVNPKWTATGNIVAGTIATFKGSS
jgi:hypothetical protein